MKKVFYTNNSLETNSLAQKFSKFLTGGDIVLLNGDLGSGKTTFTKGIGLSLGVKRVINSPTFTIVKEYKTDKYILYHFDLYRLDESSYFELDEYFKDDSICIIEWPFNVKDILPLDYILVDIIKEGEEKRRIEISGVGKYKEKIGELNV